MNTLQQRRDDFAQRFQMGLQNAQMSAQMPPKKTARQQMAEREIRDTSSQSALRQSRLISQFEPTREDMMRQQDLLRLREEDEISSLRFQMEQQPMMNQIRSGIMSRISSQVGGGAFGSGQFGGGGGFGGGASSFGGGSSMRTPSLREGGFDIQSRMSSQPSWMQSYQSPQFPRY